jgi:hypothetical protein
MNRLVDRYAHLPPSEMAVVLPVAAARWVRKGFRLGYVFLPVAAWLTLAAQALDPPSEGELAFSVTIPLIVSYILMRFFADTVPEVDLHRRSDGTMPVGFLRLLVPCRGLSTLSDYHRHPAIVYWLMDSMWVLRAALSLCGLTMIAFVGTVILYFVAGLSFKFGYVQKAATSAQKLMLLIETGAEVLVEFSIKARNSARNVLQWKPLSLLFHFYGRTH